MATVTNLTADAVIIGGGAAGAYAALQLRNEGLDPLVVCKGMVGKSGASIFAGNLHVAGHMLGSSEADSEAAFEFQVRWFNHFLIDQDYVRSLGNWIEERFYPELEEAGLYLRRDDQGTIVTSKGSVRCMGAPKQGQSGAVLMTLRRRQLARAGVRMMEEAAVTALVPDDDGRIVGAVIFHVPTGRFYAVATRAVVLATGYADRLALRSTATREQSADGIALAARAGAELMNLEIQWWHTSDFAYPPTWQRMHIYPNPLVGTSETARMHNAKGELFFEQKTDVPLSFAPYPTQLKRLMQQVMEGKARFDGGYTTSYGHIDPQVIRTYNEHYTAYVKLGLDPGADKVETAVSWHFRQGGVYVDPYTMETGVPGLYVAGSLGGHSNGSITVASYDGDVVARTIAGKRGTDERMPPIPESVVDAETMRLKSLLKPIPADGVTPVHVKNAIRRLMWEKMGPIKSGPDMQQAAEELRSLREEAAPRMGLRNTTSNSNYGWLDAIDVYNMLEACELTVESSLNRKESRGPFYRTDYPYTDNINWLVKNIVRRGAHGLEFRTEPYRLHYLEPEFERSEYFTVDW